MNIYIKRYHHSRWGVDGECFIDNQKACDCVEHPTAYLPAGEYTINKENYRNYFVRGNGPMKNLKGEICLGRHVLQGFVLETSQEYFKLCKRILKALKNHETITLIIQDYD
jgi:hypothetical protein